MLTGNVVYGGCQWGILVAGAKLGPPAMLGQTSDDGHTQHE